MKITTNPGATPLESEELEGLIPKFVTTQSQLNVYEAENILDAEKWFYQRKRDPMIILHVKFILELHKRMFSKTWKWAGTFRRTNKNIGCDKAYIVEDLTKLLEDTKYQLKLEGESHHQIAAKFHHRLVKIHPFCNGNGRHARMAADALLHSLGKNPFLWGEGLLNITETRKKYISALQAADRNDYQLLFEFLKISG